MDRVKLLRLPDGVPTAHDLGVILDLEAGFPRLAKGWKPSEWVAFLDRIYYKPGWTLDVRWDQRGVERWDGLLSWAMQTRQRTPQSGPDGEKLGIKVYINPHEDSAIVGRNHIDSMIREMDAALATRWLHIDRPN